MVLFRDDEDSDGDAHWWPPVHNNIEEPHAWDEACAELEGFRGPVLLVPAGGEAS